MTEQPTKPIEQLCHPFNCYYSRGPPPETTPIDGEQSGHRPTVLIGYQPIVLTGHRPIVPSGGMALSVHYSGGDGVKLGEEQTTESIGHNSNQGVATTSTMAPEEVTQTPGSTSPTGPRASSQEAPLGTTQEGHESEPDEHEIFTQLVAADLPKIKRRVQPKEDRTNTIIHMHKLGQAAMHVKSLDPRWRVSAFVVVDQLFHLTTVTTENHSRRHAKSTAKRSPCPGPCCQLQCRTTHHAARPAHRCHEQG